MRKTPSIQEQQLFELFSNFNYKLPKDPEQILYDFYFLTAFGEEISGRNMNANYAIEEASNLVVEMLHKHMTNAVFFAVCAEIRHLFDYFRLDGIDKKLTKNQFEFLQEYYKEYLVFNGIRHDKMGPLGLTGLVEPSKRDRELLSKEDPGNRLASYKAVKSMIKKFGWSNSQFSIFAEDVFNAKGWSSSYGGAPWASIAEALYKLERAGKKQEKIIWIDHAYDLQHNTDTVFNKLKLYYKTGGYSWIKKALDWKRDVTDLKAFYKKVSTQLRPMVAYISKTKTGQSIISAEDEEENKQKAAIRQDVNNQVAAQSSSSVGLVRNGHSGYKFEVDDVVRIASVSKKIYIDSEIQQWAESQGMDFAGHPPYITDDYKIVAIGEHQKFPGAVVAIIRPMGEQGVYLFYQDGLKKKVFPHVLSQPSAEFSEGDTVELLDDKEVYTQKIDGFSSIINKVNFSSLPLEGAEYTVVEKSHYSNPTLSEWVYLVKGAIRYFLIGENGLTKVSPASMQIDLSSDPLQGMLSNHKFSMGTTVSIPFAGKVFGNSVQWATNHGFTIQHGKTPDISHTFDIIAIGQFNNQSAYGVRDNVTGQNFVIPERDIVGVMDTAVSNSATMNEYKDISFLSPNWTNVQLLKTSYDLHQNDFSNYKWMENSVIENVKLRIDTSDNTVIWESGTWKSGTWKSGTWITGNWETGRWLNGTWKSGVWNYGIWDTGVWLNGTWRDGTWENGVWKDGTWEKGTWEKGMWKNGAWLTGKILTNGEYITSTQPPWDSQ